MTQNLRDRLKKYRCHAYARYLHQRWIIVATFCASLVQVGLFAAILVGARSAEYINTYLGRHWQEFARQNYFDEHGVFMGVMWSGPLLLLGFAMLVSRDNMFVFLNVVWLCAQLKLAATPLKKSVQLLY